MAVNIRTKTARAKLEPRREPYWHLLSLGVSLGFRKGVGAGGTWIGRRKGDDTKYLFASFGSDATKDFDEVQKDVAKWASEPIQAPVPVPEPVQDTDLDMTVSDVCRAYVKRVREGWQDHPKRPQTARDSELRFERLVYNEPFGAIKFAELTRTDVADWHMGLVGEAEDEEDEKKHKDSANRNLKTLKAALNLALHFELNKFVKDDSRWKSVKQFKGVGASRAKLLTPEEGNKFLNAMPEDLRKFARALILTGARPGEMASAQVQHYDKKTGVLKLRGKTKKWRDVYLNNETRAFFDEQTKDKIGQAFIFMREFDGQEFREPQQWQAPMWVKTVRQIRDEIGLPDIVLYHLRHAYISTCLDKGIGIFDIATLCGTSVEMIQKHYGKLIPGNIQERLNIVAML
jgi:integrase